MTRAYDEDAMRRLPRIGPRRPWWFKWIILAVFLGSVAVVPTLVWLFR